MSDQRIQALAAVWSGRGAEFTREDLEEAAIFARRYDAIRAYDAAHPQPQPESEVVHHTNAGANTSAGEPRHDKSAAPLVGADPPPAYRVEPAAAGCQECGHGTYWCIVGPDGVALGTDYFDKEAAEELAEMLTDAWHAGRSDAVAHLTDDAVVEEMWEAIYNFRQDPDYWATLLRAFNDPEVVESAMRAALAAVGKALLGEPT